MLRTESVYCGWRTLLLYIWKDLRSRIRENQLIVQFAFAHFSQRDLKCKTQYEISSPIFYTQLTINTVFLYLNGVTVSPCLRQVHQVCQNFVPVGSGPDSFILRLYYYDAGPLREQLLNCESRPESRQPLWALGFRFVQTNESLLPSNCLICSLK